MEVQTGMNRLGLMTIPLIGTGTIRDGASGRKVKRR